MFITNTSRAVALAVVAALMPAGLAPAQTTSTYVPTGGPSTDTWSNADSWDTANAPVNGQPSVGNTYNAIVNTGTIAIDGDFEVQAFNFAGGTLSKGGSGSTSSLTINELFTFEEGTIFARNIINANGGIAFTGPGNRRLNNSFSATSSNKSILNHTGTGTWTGGNIGGTLISSPELRSEFNHLAGSMFDVTAPGGSFAPRFNNFGTVDINPGAGNTIDMDMLFNDGVFNIHSGTLDIDYAINQEYRASEGDFIVNDGATLRIAAHDIGATGSITGDGDVYLSGNAGRVIIDGSYNIGGTTTLLNRTTFANPATTGQLILDGTGGDLLSGGGYSTGIILGGTLNVTGQTTWVDGALNGDGIINALGGVSFDSTQGRQVIQDNVVLNLYSDSVLTAESTYNIYIDDNAELNIHEGATLTFLRSAAIDGDTPGTLNNAGTLEAAGGTITVNTNAVNTGLMIANGFGNNVSFNNNYKLDQQAGELRLLGGRISSIGAFTGGKLTGFGTTNQLIITAGTISPGMTNNASDPIGMIEFDGLVLASGAVLEFDLAGTELHQHDHLFVDIESTFQNFGDMQLDGNLVLRFAQGFENTVSETDTFTIIKAIEPTTGAFANVAAGDRLLTADGLGWFTVNYGSGSAFGDNMVVLSDFEPIPEPGSLLLLGAASLFCLQCRRPRRKA